jgi:ClpP class serine protease
MINFSLAKEIYGVTPWMMDTHSVPVMTSILRDIKNGVRFDSEVCKLNSTCVYDFKNDVKIIEKEYQLNTREDFEGIGLINLNGPITKSGGQSTVGMEELSAKMQRMSADNRIKGFIILTDSGGGSSSAVEMMIDTINEVKKSKPVYSLVTKGGMAASAAYGIISASTKIYSESEMNIVGSIGTMIQFEGKEANSQDRDGVKYIRLYATKSTKKNEGFEQALNDDNYKVIINEMLDPINENFINKIAENRPSIKATTFDDGKTYFSKDVVGTFVDGIASFSEVVQMLTKSKEFGPKKNEFNTNINNKKMTKAEFKTAHPDAYNEIVAEGIAQEQDRAGAWMAHVNTDSKAVAEGIKSGLPLSQSQREEFFVKQNSKLKIESMKTDSAEDVVVDESITDPDKIANKEKEAEIKAAFGFDLK